jgi:hypothetical protein
MEISNERFKTLFLNWWKMYEKDMTLSDMEDLCKDIGMTRGEFIELVSQSNEFITKSGWTPPEPETNEKVNTEDIPIGDTDQAILETALTQIGIKYKFHEEVGFNWIEIETPYNNDIEINFNDKGEFLEICV